MGLVIAACNGSDLTRTENVFDATHVARLTGVVTTQSGQPLDSVRVSISIPATADYRYADESVLTNADGRYAVTVRRTVAPAQVASPDTVRVPIVSLTLRAAHRAADGSAVRSTSSAIVQFVPHVQEPLVQTVNLVVALPE
jgi:hypothetical protein